MLHCEPLSTGFVDSSNSSEIIKLKSVQLDLIYVSIKISLLFQKVVSKFKVILHY